MKKKLIPVLIALVLICILGAMIVVPMYKEKYAYSKERVDLTEYFECSGEQARIMMQDSLLEERALIRDGAVYFDYDTVSFYMEDRFYYNEAEQNLKYTLPGGVETVWLSNPSVCMVHTPGMEETIAVNGEYAQPICFFEGETMYLLADYVQRYCNMTYTLYSDPYRVQVFHIEDEVTTATVTKKTSVRRLGGRKSAILTDVSSGDEVVVLEVLENWTRVKTADCIVGWLENKYLKDEKTTVRKGTSDYQDPVYPVIQKDYKIAMGWHQVMAVSGNDTLGTVTANAEALNVISPTWFKLNDNEGGFENLATTDYVTKAHGKGLEVWALVDDFTYEVDLLEILSDTAKRERLELQLVAAALNAGVDGINIDFEKVSNSCGIHFVQFLKELSILTHANNLVLSVDNYVPEGGRNQYDLKEQGIVVDYVVIMGYDEHWAGCQEAGSVASAGFVERGIRDTINRGVEPSRIINGVPFYTRIWETTGGSVASSAVSMETAKEWISNHGIETIWDDETQQNYGERQSGESYFQVWLEDQDSLQVKFNIMNSHGIAGMAAWKLGYELPSIWDLVAAYVNS